MALVQAVSVCVQPEFHTDWGKLVCLSLKADKC